MSNPQVTHSLQASRSIRSNIDAAEHMPAQDIIEELDVILGKEPFWQSIRARVMVIVALSQLLVPVLLPYYESLLGVDVDDGMLILGLTMITIVAGIYIWARTQRNHA